MDAIEEEFEMDRKDIEDLMDRVENFLSMDLPVYVKSRPTRVTADRSRKRAMDDVVEYFWQQIYLIFELKGLDHNEFVERLGENLSVRTWIRVIRTAVDVVVSP